MPMQRVLLLAVAAVFATTVYAADPKTTNEDSSRSDARHCPAIDEAPEPLPVGAGLRAFIDPATGLLREPTDGESAAFAAASRVARNKSIEGLEVEYRKDGSKFVDLQGRFMHSLRVTRNADGTTSYVCTDLDSHPHPHATQAAAPAEK